MYSGGSSEQGDTRAWETVCLDRLVDCGPIGALGLEDLPGETVEGRHDDLADW